MKKILLISIFLLLSLDFCSGQFLSYDTVEKNNAFSVGYYNHYFRFNDSEKELMKSDQLGFKKYIPEICFENRNLSLFLAYNKSNYEGKNMELFGLDGYYKLFIPVTEPSWVQVSVPVILRTGYKKVVQELEKTKTRLETGNAGIGSGFQIENSSDIVDVRLFYSFCINYSTINFSVDYGFSTQNDIILSFAFDNIFDDYGILIGAKYSDQKWKISDKKYNYYTSIYGGFIGITF